MLEDGHLASRPRVPANHRTTFSGSAAETSPENGEELRAPQHEHGANRAHHNDGIERERLVPDVIQVVLQLAKRVLHAVSVAKAHLCPASQARFYGQPCPVVGDLTRQHLHHYWSLRAWTNDAHLAAQDVDELRYLVQSRLTQNLAHMGDAGVVRRCPPRPGIALGVFAHRA